MSQITILASATLVTSGPTPANPLAHVRGTAGWLADWQIHLTSPLHSRAECCARRASAHPRGGRLPSRTCHHCGASTPSLRAAISVLPSSCSGTLGVRQSRQPGSGSYYIHYIHYYVRLIFPSAAQINSVSCCSSPAFPAAVKRPPLSFREEAVAC